MPILKRDDGIQFVIQTYRELLAPVKASLFKNEIRMLAQNHGEYVRLFKQADGQIEAVFSREPGFLLGETVWQYFGKAADLIYCEALPETSQALVVVVRSGNVYLDTKIPFSSIIDEFTSLVTGAHQYDIYVYGDVPLSETKQRGKFNFDRSQVKSYTQLEQPVFNQLPADESLQLQPLELALQTQRVIRKPPVLIITICILVLLLIGYLYHRHHPKKVVPVAPRVVTQAPTPTNPFIAYETALMTPAPQQQLQQVANMMVTLSDLPGWQASSVTFDGSTYTIQLNADAGGESFILLNKWASSHNMDLTITDTSAKLTFASKLPNRSKPTAIYNLADLTYLLMDRLNNVLAEQGLTADNITSQDATKSRTITIELNNVAPDTFNLIGRQLYNLPVKLNSVQANIENGLISGSIQLTILGK